MPTRDIQKDWEFEASTISWLPVDFLENPHLCVFDGPGGPPLHRNNQCPYRNAKTSISKTHLKLAADAKNAVGMWGPMNRKPGFDLGVKRMRLLDSGEIKSPGDDRLVSDRTRSPSVAFMP